MMMTMANNTKGTMMLIPMNDSTERDVCMSLDLKNDFLVFTGFRACIAIVALHHHGHFKGPQET
jgi:hypothetical protein